MVDVVQSNGSRSSQPLRSVEHVLAAVALRHRTFLVSSFWFSLPEQFGYTNQKPETRNGFQIGALSIRGVRFGCLIQTRVEGGLKK
jgi:hypothetical protein